MAPAAKILKELKGVNFSCSSPASSTTTDEQYSSMLVSLGSSGRAIDRFSPHIRDPLRAKSINPDLTAQFSSGSSSSSSSPKKKNVDKKAKERAPAQQQQKQQQLISPASSSRYLLSGSASDDLWHSPQAPPVGSEVASEAAWRLQSAKVPQSSAFIIKADQEPSAFQFIKLEQSTTTTTTPTPTPDPESSSSSPSSSSCSTSSSSTRPQNHQVVVLRVSLHCKGCEGKVRKHISKMEGVTSFTTDLVNKKVTVIGDVTPLGVLNSISKVKNAQLWRSLPPTSAFAKNLY